jgi:ferredoxin
MYSGLKCLGLTPQSNNEEKKKSAFDFVFGIGYMSFATTATDGKTPTCRGLEVHRLDDLGNMYVGASHGKHFYDELELMPYVCGVAIDTISVRISAWVRKTDDDKIRERYWELNQGTKKMYRKDLSNFQVYVMEKGDGEVFHVYEDDAIARVRFSFGGALPRPWTYVISDDCTGCGACVQKCMLGVIELRNGVAWTDHYGCNECGICYESCSFGAIVKNEFV